MDAVLIEEVRRFNRFYTRQIGVLQEGLLDSPYPLTQARVIFELGHGGESTATRLRETLDLDAGYLSRILATLEQGGLVERHRSPDDARQQLVSLTSNGEAAFSDLDQQSDAEVAQMLSALSNEDRRRLAAAMTTIEQVLTPGEAAPAVVLRPPRVGDYGWVVQRHGALYGQEYGWDETFEALVARIVADHVEQHDPRWERAWIAELRGEPVGSIFCVDAGQGVAKLRLLLVEPSARGRGIGRLLVEECIRFARATGYREMVLWTQRVLVAARRVYEQTGFHLVDEEHVDRFGKPQVSETWRLDLTA